MYSQEEIRKLGFEAIEARMNEIKAEMEADDADITALTDEVDNLEARKNELKDAADKKKELRSRVAKGLGVTVRHLTEEEKAPAGIDSKEYRNAWLKNIRGDKLSDAEKRVLVTGITGTTPGEGTDVTAQSLLVPTEIVGNIWNLIEEQHPILGDATVYRTGVVIEVLVHTASSGASIVAENASPDEESNTFAKKTLAGKDFAKYIDLSYAMERMSIDALQSYLQNEIGQQMGYKMATDAILTIEESVETTAVEGYSYANVCAAFGALKRVKNVVIYGTRADIYTNIIGMVDDNGRPIFQADPTGKAIGTVLGAPVKVEDAVTEGFLIGDPKRFVYNMVQDIMIESDRDIKKHVTTYSGYARGEGVLVDTESFVVLKGE